MCGRYLSSVLATFASLIFSGVAGSETASSSTSTPPVSPASPLTPWVGFTSALAWPIAAILIALVFRKPLGKFLGGLAGRVTKLSAFKVEMELAKAPSVAAGPLLDDIRSATTLAPIADSTRMMLEQAQIAMPADFAVIDLGAGEEWLTSRLFVAATMLKRMRGAKVFVFLETTPDTLRRFVAIGTMAEVRWWLAGQYPWLEAAWLRTYMNIFPSGPPTTAPAGTTVPVGAAWLPDPLTLNIFPSPIQPPTGAFEPWRARDVVSQYIQLLQIPAPGAVPASSAPASVMAPVVTVNTTVPGDTWVTFASGTQERAAWVTRSMLESMLPQEAFELFMDEARDAPRSKRTRALLRRRGPFVALVRGDREYVRLVNRSKLVEELAAYSGEEPE